MNNNMRRLPDAELEVMQALWACNAPVVRADIEAILFKTHPMAMTTLLTLLTRLSEKGYIQIEKVGRSSRYTPRRAFSPQIPCVHAVLPRPQSRQRGAYGHRKIGRSCSS